MNNSIPYITIQEKINLSVLGDLTPALIVEGKTDLKVYKRLLLKSRIEKDKYDMVVGKCKSEILKHHDNYLPFKYIALVDADYDHYRNSCREDEKIIYTHFYTMENYLTLSKIIDKTIEDIKNIDSKDFVADEILKRAINAIEAIIIFSLIKVDSSWPIKIEDCSVQDNRWWNKNTCSIDLLKFKNYIVDNLRLHDINTSELELDKKYCEKKQYLYDHFDHIDIFVHGKHKLESVFNSFKTLFSTEMEHRNINTFIGDLCKNIFESEYTQDLLTQIDTRLEAIV